MCVVVTLLRSDLDGCVNVWRSEKEKTFSIVNWNRRPKERKKKETELCVYNIEYNVFTFWQCVCVGLYVIRDSTHKYRVPTQKRYISVFSSTYFSFNAFIYHKHVSVFISNRAKKLVCICVSFQSIQLANEHIELCVSFNKDTLDQYKQISAHIHIIALKFVRTQAISYSDTILINPKQTI